MRKCPALIMNAGYANAQTFFLTRAWHSWGAQLHLNRFLRRAKKLCLPSLSMHLRPHNSEPKMEPSPHLKKTGQQVLIAQLNYPLKVRPSVNLSGTVEPGYKIWQQLNLFLLLSNPKVGLSDSVGFIQDAFNDRTRMEKNLGNLSMDLVRQL